MPQFGNRVKETTDTTGTGTLDLSGAATGFRSFGDEFTNGDSEVSYLIVDDPDNPTSYEYGKGTYTAGTPDTLSRDTVEGSSNAGSKVSFVAGTKTVIATPTAQDLKGLETKVRAITGDTTQVASDNGKLIDADGSGNSPVGLTFTLLPAATAGNGFRQTVKNTGASGTVTVDANGSETIDGALTVELASQLDVVSLRCDGTAWHVEAGSPVAALESPLPPWHLTGLEISNNGTDAAHDIDVATGKARDDTDAANLVLASALTKRIDAVWAVGTNAGGLDTGTVAADTWYRVFLIRRSDTGVVDVLFSASDSPTMPTNYDQKRRIGYVLTDSASDIIAFQQFGDEFWWNDVATDIGLDINTTVGTTASLHTMSAPPSTLARVAYQQEQSIALLLSPTAIADQAPSLSASPLGTSQINVSAASLTNADLGGLAEVWLDSSSQLRARQSSSDNVKAVVHSWIDSRGKYG